MTIDQEMFVTLLGKLDALAERANAEGHEERAAGISEAADHLREARHYRDYGFVIANGSDGCSVSARIVEADSGPILRAGQTVEQAVPASSGNAEQCLSESAISTVIEDIERMAGKAQREAEAHDGRSDRGHFCEGQAHAWREAAKRLRSALGSASGDGDVIARSLDPMNEDEVLDSLEPMLDSMLQRLVANLRREFTPEMIREIADPTEYDSFAEMVATVAAGERPTSAVAIFRTESGLYSLIAFRPVTELVMFVEANAGGFANASWRAHNCPSTEEQAIEAGHRLAAMARK